ncbi:GTP cyclohydrolase 1 type 2 [Clostridiales bacterium]|nr:GTP cyclohydrolase 1 type 2 [Clostridiales bacterium]
MHVQKFNEELNRLYPKSLSCPWDNDGLMCCANPMAEVKKVLVALDATRRVLDYAAANQFDLVLTHHPLLFRGPKSISPDTAVGSRIISALQKNLTVISLHTRLDAGKEGVNDCLAAALELAGPLESFGDDESPTLGRIGTTNISNGAAFADHVKKVLETTAVCAYLCRPVRRVAVCGGSGGDLVLPAAMTGADTIVTGECGYNTCIDSAEAGINVITAGHFFTEHPVCRRLAQLAQEIAGAQTEIISSDTAVVV